MRLSGRLGMPVASACGAKSPWESALAYYQLSLVEVGFSLELEHAQRIALLYLKKQGESKQLSSWARLFFFEEVPTCSLMLKALVRHDLWRSAINLWTWNPNTVLGEALVDELMSKNLWEQSLFVVNRFLLAENFRPDSLKSTVKAWGQEKNIESDVVLAVDDAFGLATDPSFIPPEEKNDKNTLPRLVNTVFPLKSQWHKAASLLVRLCECCTSSETQKGLLELAAARSTYHGERFEDIFHWVKQTKYVRYSTSLQQTFFFLAVFLQRFEDAFIALEALSKQGLDDVPSGSLQDFCTKFIYEYNQGKHVEFLDRFSTLVLKCSSRIRCKKTLDELKVFLKNNAVNTNALDIWDTFERSKAPVSCFSDRSFVQIAAPSISEIDETASVLYRQGRWKDSLELLKKLVETQPVNEKEHVIRDAVKVSLGSWETAILFLA